MAIELLHCASLVYDDLPCFDDSPLRRGRAAVHALHGEDLAILAATGLTVLAFDVVACEPGGHAQLSLDLLQVIAQGAGSPCGIVAGQAWEAETTVADLRAYHRAKTGALFESAFLAGAMAGGGDPSLWRGLGHQLGEAYQIADDLRDVWSTPERLGKPIGQDEANGRPSAVTQLGAANCVRRIDELVTEVCARIPACDGRTELLSLIRHWSLRLLPQSRNPISAARTAALTT